MTCPARDRGIYGRPARRGPARAFSSPGPRGKWEPGTFWRFAPGFVAKRRRSGGLFGRLKKRIAASTAPAAIRL